jgi:RHS repeat-associated protein
VYRTTDPTPVVLKRYGYAYDPAGNRTTEQIDNAPMQSTFDNRNRLTAQQPGGALLFKGTLNEPATVTVAGTGATVDPANKFHGTAPVASGTSNVVVTATDPSGNLRTNIYQVTVSGTSKTYTYDVNGSLTAEGTKTYEWDGANRLIRVLDGGGEVARFVYDGLGRRSQRIAGGVTRTYVYDGEDILEERLSTGPTSRYVHGLGIDQPLARVEAGAPTYYLADHLGSIVQETSAAASVTLTRQYDAWGNLPLGSGTAGYAFTGREWDAEASLYYYRARYYDPKLGRFISEDPIGFDGGSNFYVYALNDPVNLLDPSGLCPTSCSVTVRCRPVGHWPTGLVAGISVGVVIPQHCYIVANGGSGPMSLSGSQGATLGAGIKSFPNVYDSGTDAVVSQEPVECDVVRCLEQTTSWFNRQGFVYNPVTGPNSNSFVSGAMAMCGLTTNLPTGAFGRGPRSSW